MHEKYMRRCFDLARLGAQTASPNPLVGAVIVHENVIIGEGFHHTRGEAHAEVNAIAAVSEADKGRIRASTIYISLEPCSHQGLTPPCTDLILANGIKHVVISAVDPNPEVSGKGIAGLRANDVSVVAGVLEEEGNQLIGNFKNAMTEHRPYLILKFVQSSDRYIGHPDYQVWLSNGFEKVLVHKLRSEVDGIMVGTNTVLVDNPQLTNREYFGNDPVRITFDRNRRIPSDFHILDGSIPTLVYTAETDQNTTQPDTEGTARQHASGIVQSGITGAQHPEFVSISFDEKMLHHCLKDLIKRNIQSVLVEGGASLINSFVKQNLWDEAWVVTTNHVLSQGVKAPLLNGNLVQKFSLDMDEIQVIKRI